MTSTNGATAYPGERLGIVGSGTIACGLAACAARHGHVTLWARSDASAERAKRTVAKVSSKFPEPLPPDRVTIRTDLSDGLADMTFVVEAIAEQLDAKVELFGRIEDRLDERAVLGTTTSSLSLAKLAEASGRPERFVGFHVFNPVAKMELIELAFPATAAPETRHRARALADMLEKRAVEVPSCSGFVVNRLLFPYLFDAVRFAEEYDMDPGSVDACMTLGAGHPMGPLALLDYVGLDVSMAIGESLGVEVPQRIRELVAEGALGKKVKRGFYTYD
jgi:3-hydroxybutyryl-CoA dehydrogenase